MPPVGSQKSSQSLESGGASELRQGAGFASVQAVRPAAAPLRNQAMACGCASAPQASCLRVRPPPRFVPSVKFTGGKADTLTIYIIGNHAAYQYFT